MSSYVLSTHYTCVFDTLESRPQIFIDRGVGDKIHSVTFMIGIRIYRKTTKHSSNFYTNFYVYIGQPQQKINDTIQCIEVEKGH
jgi:hypothetical protein